MAGEMTSDETLTDSNRAALYTDLALLDPRNFAEVASGTLPDSAFQELSKCLLGFDSRATAVNLQSELKCLAAMA